MSKSIQQPGNIIDPENAHDNPEEGVQEENKIDDTLAQGGSASTHQGVIETVGADNLDPTNAPQLDQEVFDLAYSMRTEQPSMYNSWLHVVDRVELIGVERVVNAIISGHTGDITVNRHFAKLASNVLMCSDKIHNSSKPRVVDYYTGIPNLGLDLTYEQINLLVDYLIEHDVLKACGVVIKFLGAQKLIHKVIVAILEQRNIRAARSFLHFTKTEQQKKEFQALIASEEAES